MPLIDMVGEGDTPPPRVRPRSSLFIDLDFVLAVVSVDAAAEPLVHALARRVSVPHYVAELAVLEGDLLL